MNQSHLSAGKAMHECGPHAIRKHEVSKPRKDIIDQPQSLQASNENMHDNICFLFSISYR